MNGPPPGYKPRLAFRLVTRATLPDLRMAMADGRLIPHGGLEFVLDVGAANPFDGIPLAEFWLGTSRVLEILDRVDTQAAFWERE